MLCFRCGSFNADDVLRCTVCGQDVAGGSRKIPTGQHAALIFVPGEVVAGRYTIMEQIGAGGVGAVYRARDTEVDVDVALKGISPNLLQTEEEQKNFSKAMKAARKLQHPNIVRLYEEGMHQQPNRRFFTMKLLDGLTLRKIIRLRHDQGQAFSADEIIPIFQQLAAALDYAHKQTWHGDVKPENVIVLPDVLKLTDFNLVKALPLKPFLGIAKSRSKGFPYIAPELRVEAQRIDGRVDVYSLGVMLAEMLTGLVYEGHFSKAFSAALEQLSPRLDGLIRRALAEHPDGRFTKASELVTELEDALVARGSTPLPPPVMRTSGLPAAAHKAPESVPPRKVASPPAEAPPKLVETTPPLASHSPRPPPPPREETNPSISGLSAALSEEGLLELGQSQVVLLGSEVKGAAQGPLPLDAQPPTNASPTVSPGMVSLASLDSVADSSGEAGPWLDDSLPSLAAEDVALAARRLMGLESSNPDDTIDEPTLRVLPDEVDTNPGAKPKKGRGRTSDAAGRGAIFADPEAHPPGPDELLATIYSDEGDNRLIPPPLPKDASDDGDDASVLEPDEDEPTQNRPQAALSASLSSLSSLSSLEALPAEVPIGASDPGVGPSPFELPRTAADDLGLVSEDGPGVSTSSGEPPSGEPPSVEEGEIHEALTALHRHPRPDLVEDEALRDVLTRTDDAVSEASAAPPPVPPPLEDDSLNDTRSIVKASPGAFTDEQRPSPPSSRPVAIPKRPPPVAPPSKSPSPVVVGAAAALVALLVLLGVRVANKADPTEPSDGATVTLQPPPPGDRPLGEPVLAPPLTPPPAAAPVPVPVPAVDDAKERALAERRAREEMERRERAALSTGRQPPEPSPSPPPAPSPAPTPAPSPATAPPPAPAPVVVALAEAGECPTGMAKIDAGSFTFGSSDSDPMRNFGELNAGSVSVKTYCIDYYEYPNGAKVLPTTGVAWTTAKSTCEKSGKRLCSEQEWERACKGPGSGRFPYGNGYNVDTCNTVDAEGKARPLARAADFKKCRSDFKVYMQSGNAEEWVADAAGGQRIAKGGASDRPDFASRCSARRALPTRTASPMLGFRCCADVK